MLLLTACTDFTKANGRVTDTFGMPLDNVLVTLEHSRGLFQTTSTNNLGEFYLDVIEPCLLICVGTNPILTFTKQDYEPVQTTVEPFGNVCVNVWMRVVGDRSQVARTESC
jgi:hypothetical protein